MKLSKEQVDQINEIARIMGVPPKKVVNIILEKTAGKIFQEKLNEMIKGKGKETPKGFLSDL